MARTTWILVLSAIVAGAFLGCGPGEEENHTGVYPERLGWTAHANVSSYRVQAWSDLRLLFEESVPETSLTLTPSLLRAMAPFDSCRIEVRAVGDERRPPEVFWVRKEPQSR